MKRISIGCLWLAFVAASFADKECIQTSMDLMFVLDGSGSVREENWEIVKSWVNTFVSSLDLDDVHVGVVQYSHWFRMKTEIKLQEITNLAKFQDSVRNIGFQGYTTYTAHAINKTVNEDFASSDRFHDPSVKKVMILLTDGKSMDGSDLRYSANYARSTGITIFAIGVGNFAQSELQIIANGEVGNNERVLELENFAELDDTVSFLQKDVCTLVKECRYAPVDLMFVLDGSYSVTRGGRFPQNWDNVKMWLNTFVSSLHLEEIQVGVVQYSHWYKNRIDQPFIETEIELGKITNLQDFKDSVNKIEIHGYKTFTAHAINKTVNEDFKNSERFYDPSVAKVMIVLTDGRATDGTDLPYSANYARSAGITIFAVGVGEYDESELQIIANGEVGNNERVMEVEKFSDLNDKVASLQDKVCSFVEG